MTLRRDTRERAARGATLLLFAALAAAIAAGCGHRATAPAVAAPRSFRMGFSAVPPRADSALTIQSVLAWAPRSDAALLLSEPPWGPLLRGVPPESVVKVVHLPLAQFYRALGLRVIVSVDATNGLNRAADSDTLVAYGRSIAEPAIQSIYRAYCVAMDTLIHPDWIGVASETNLVRAVAPSSIYTGLVQAANGAATDIHASDASARVFTTVQVETAWGRLPATSGYVGIDQDLADFPFVQAVGLSSYPYFTWADPDSLPLDYYARLVPGHALPVMVIEGGWTSASIGGGIVSDPAKQARYLRQHAALLDAARAAAWFQITFTDLDLTGLPAPLAASLDPFAHNGLVTATLASKPALAVWDAVHARPYVP